jgi:hypothetical protein
MSRSPLHRDHPVVLAQARALAARAEGSDERLATRVERVSRWSVAQQLEHMAIVDRGVLGVLDRALAEPARDAARRPLLVGRLLLALGWIPRGVGKAPERSQPQNVEPAALRELWRATIVGFEALAPRLDALAASRARARHPRFGWLDAGLWLRFAAVHHHHHTKIVRDIERAAPPSAGAGAR